MLVLSEVPEGRAMRWVGLLLLLGACGSRSDEAADGNAARAEAAASQQLAEQLGAQGEAGLRRRLESLTAILADPSYRQVRSGPMGAVCGEVDTKLRDGARTGFRPFVIAPDGFPLISTTARINYDDPEDMFPDAYIRWCASPDEMERIAALVERRQMGAAAGTPGDVPDPALDPALIPDVPSAAPPIVAEAAPPPAMVAPAPRAPDTRATPPARSDSSDEDSFFRSVVRPQTEKGTAQ